MKSINWIVLYKNCLFNLDKDLVKLNGEDIPFTSNEINALRFLVKNRNNTVNFETLYWQLYPEKMFQEYNNKPLRNIVSNIRKKLPEINIENIYGVGYILKIDPCYSKSLELYISEFLDQAANGMVITDPDQDDNPIIYVNDSFCKIFNYNSDEIIGKNCRFLQLDDREQEELDKVRIAIKQQVPITAFLRNYTKEGDLIYTEVTISPIFNKVTKELIYFLGVQKVIDKTYYETHLNKQ